jgi:hypothetical protein
MLTEIIWREKKTFEFGRIRIICLLQNTTSLLSALVEGLRSGFLEQTVRFHRF